MITKEKLINVLLNKRKLWNRYSELCSNKNIIIDLSYADLSKADLRHANLRHADLRYAILDFTDLRHADLRYAILNFTDLSHTNLMGADLDFGCLGLSCKTLNTKFDEKHIIQFLYHALKPIQNNKDIINDKEIKKLLKNKTLLRVVNKFHRVDECGRIEF